MEAPAAAKPRTQAGLALIQNAVKARQAASAVRPPAALRHPAGRAQRTPPASAPRRLARAPSCRHGRALTRAVGQEANKGAEAPGALLVQLKRAGTGRSGSAAKHVFDFKGWCVRRAARARRCARSEPRPPARSAGSRRCLPPPSPHCAPRRRPSARPSSACAASASRRKQARSALPAPRPPSHARQPTRTRRRSRRPPRGGAAAPARAARRRRSSSRRRRRRAGCWPRLGPSSRA